MESACVFGNAGTGMEVGKRKDVSEDLEIFLQVICVRIRLPESAGSYHSDSLPAV